MRVREHLLQKFKTSGELAQVTCDGKWMSTISPVPGWGGFGLLSPNPSIEIDGRKATLHNVRSGHNVEDLEFTWG